MPSTDLVGPLVVHVDDEIRYHNAAFRTLVGAESTADLGSRPLPSFVAPASREQLTDQFDRLRHTDTDALGLLIDLEVGAGEQIPAIAVTSRTEWNDAFALQTTFVELGHADSQWSLRETAMEQAPIGITIVDITQQEEPLIYVNDGFCALTGYDRRDVLGRNCRLLQGADTRQEPVSTMRAAIDAREATTVEVRNYRKDGTLFWNRITLSPVEDECGDVTHYLGFQVDVSPEKIYEREKTLFEKHAEASEQMLFITDAEGRIEYVNPACERLTGYTASEAVGETPLLFRATDHETALPVCFTEEVDPDEIYTDEHRNQTKTGEHYRVEQTVVPIRNDRGELTHFVAIERNVTDERLTEQILDVVDRVLRHNVRTSINIIDGYAAVLSDAPSEDEIQYATTAIREQTAALTKISDQTTMIRDLVRGHSDPQPFDLAELTALIDRARERFDGATIECSLPEESLAVKNGTLFVVALEAAIENAVVHTDQPTSVVAVDVTRRDASSVTVTIADNGPGIPDEEWKVIELGTETPLMHTQGVGLWLIYWAVTALGGTISRHANDPRGTVLELTVPVVSADQAD